MWKDVLTVSTNKLKRLLKLAIIIFLLSTTSCVAQKMVQRIDDSQKLKLNEKQFIGKPLKVLLDQIGPQIKAALGNPEIVSNRRLNDISFYFTDKSGYYSREKKGENPTIILVTLKRPGGKKYPALSPTQPWTKKQTKIYGDMIVMRINVSGEN